MNIIIKYNPYLFMEVSSKIVNVVISNINNVIINHTINNI